MLFERQIAYLADWEAVVTPVVDHLCSRPKVDPDRIAITGCSMYGEAVVRATALEHRLAAVIPDPPVAPEKVRPPADEPQRPVGGAEAGAGE